MKKTLIALLLLGGVALGAADDTWTFGTTSYGAGSATGGNGYKGIAFTLGAEASSDRYTTTTTTEYPYEAGTALTLQTIKLASRNGNSTTDIPENLTLMVTDTTGKLVGLSTSHTRQNTKINGVDYTRMISTFGFSADAPVTLTSGSSYFAYFVTSEIASTLSPDFVLTTENYANTVTGATNLFAYKKADENYTDTTNANWGFMTGYGAAQATPYVPNMLITATAAPAVPEPATGTLSLLALAGLMARRRRK